MELLYIGLLGGLLALDTTSVGQFMFSRPLVAGAITGWVLGDLSLGLTIGVVLETWEPGWVSSTAKTTLPGA